MIYDIIGDIHGQADQLVGLLRQLGYHHDGKSFIAPPNHQAIFIGDFIDRGAQQLATLNIVFDMIDNHQAKAVMGNHEYNAIGYILPCDDGEYLRPHTPSNVLGHQAFIDEVGHGTALHRHWVSRFYELPLWLEFDDFICVHACYDRRSMDLLTPLLDERRLTQEALAHICQKHSKERGAIEYLLKGIESPLPEGFSMTDKTGIVRQRARVKWWVNDWQTLSIDQTLLADDLPAILPAPLSDELAAFDIDTDKPIFIGHYWLDGTPAMLSKQVVCVDYSVGKDGHLTAYQFDTDNPTLSNENFVQYLGG